ncbi:sensor histidine kinase [Sphingomonas sp. LHG3443-2]|uniref:sensor histidine kinase n=1 Tax=Sphingomonas sp. LHG3443-2 TaxID=2804639 RepID=UPI003CE75CB7
MVKRSRRFVAFFLAALALVLALAFVAADRWSRITARDNAELAAQSVARANQGLLVSELQKFRLLPLVLAEFPDVAEVLADANPEATAHLNAQLELLAGRTDAAVIYLIGRDGVTRAASNWRLRTSFVGQNYGFRPYFRGAMRDGASELFALGTVSGRPGLYLARRIDQNGRALGTIVVKVEFDRLEKAWGVDGGIGLVTDPHGVVLVTSRPAWRFKTTEPLSRRALEDAVRTLQFGPSPPARAPLSLSGSEASVGAGRRQEPYVAGTLPAPIDDGRLTALVPLQPFLEDARRVALLWGLAILLVAGAIVAVLLRQWDRQRMLLQSRAALSLEVERQTAELRDTNARLLVESQEREEATNKYVAAREDLARANRLGTLGQITAGVAHEINQPVAAIRTFAENSTKLITRSRPEDAQLNLGRIIALTERIASITSELRSFTRRKTPVPVQATLGSIVDGALLLLGAKASSQIEIAVSRADREHVLVGDRVRLEQVLINLLRNALDAVGKRPGAIQLTASAQGDRMTIRIVDRGPGIDPAIRERLFTPFETAKSGGLGLGLAIARDIAREFDGDLWLDPMEGPGAAFIVSLRIAR